MKINTLNFNIELFSLEKKLLKVTLTLKTNGSGNITLFKNKVKTLNLESTFDFCEKNNFIYLNKTSDSEFKLSYLASVSYFSKHGIYGFLSEKLITFGGEQFLILPLEILNGTTQDCIININYNFDSFSNISIPFKNENSTNLTLCNWGNIYELLKSSYSFSNIKSYLIKDNFTLSSNYEISTDILNNLNALYDYYFSLFKTNIKLHISSIDVKSQYKLFSGSGRKTICADFDFKNKRDWQLLSHRMFHAFMDSKLDNSIFHMPPNLWVTEGLATYYEHKALEVLDSNFKKELKISFEEEFKNLHRIYRYSIENNPELYGFSPMAEGELKVQALIEYLHYYKAPLLINFFENESSLNLEDKFINYLLSIRDLNNFSQVDMFYNILQEKINEFSMKYIFGTEIIPTSLDLSGNTSDIKTSIENFKYIMNSWFALDNIDAPYDM